MDNDVRQSGLPSTPEARTFRMRALAKLFALAACLVLFAGSYALVRWALSDGQAAVSLPQHGPAPKYFAGWDRPDFVVVISGQTFGYLQPCGCSEPQYGGLARRWEFINSLKQKGWHVVPLDLGDIFPKSSDTPAQQNLFKYETAMRALHAMGYRAIGIGKQELGVPLTTALAQYSAQDNPRPRPVAANLAGVDPAGMYHALNARPFEIIEGKGGVPAIGVVGMIGKTVQDHFKNDMSLAFADQQVAAALNDLAKQGTKLNILLLQTDHKPGPGAEPEVEKSVSWCMQQAQTRLHLVIHSHDDPEPPSQLQDFKETQLVTVGHKGKYVGVLGVWNKGGGFAYKYEMVLMGPEFEPTAVAANPVAKLMEEYTRRVKERNLIAQFPRTPHKTQVLLRGRNIDARYVGSEICASCHTDAHKIWGEQKGKLAHHKAYETLVEAKDPALRQFDGECMQCHTTGFKHDWGYNDPRYDKPADAKEKRKFAELKSELLGVGCESCHGPAGAHVKNVNDMEIRKLINPWAKRHNVGLPENVRRQRINTFCQSCHDIENDVHWDFDKSWPKVEHMTPAKKN